jgi:hypothetical protein
VQVTYPGVYVTEIPSSVRPIASVSTSIGAFIDFFAEGDTTRAVQIFGMADFERYFGGIDPDSKASYQIAQFFLNGGPSAWIVRVAPGAVSAAISSQSAAAGLSITTTAATPGAWGNALRVSVDPVVDPATGKASDSLFDLYVSRYASASDTGPPITSEKYLGVSVDPASSRYVVSVVNEASQLVTVRADVSPTPLPEYSGTVGGSIDTSKSWDNYNTQTFTVTIGSDTFTPKFVGAATGDKDLRNLRAGIERAIRLSGASDPRIAGATVTLIGDRLQFELGRRSPKYNPTDVMGISGTNTIVAAMGFSATTGTANVQEYMLGSTVTKGGQKPPTNGVGDDGPRLRAMTATDTAAFTAAVIGDPVAKTGLYALEDVDLFNLLSLPVAVELDASVATPTNFTAIMSHAVPYCEQRRAFMLVDIPASIDTPQKVQDWVDSNASAIKSANTAVYFPRVELPDPENEFRLGTFGASGTLAGIYARTDTDRGVWKAPAGIDAVLRGVGALDYRLTDAENGVLNPLGIDCLRVFPIYGQVAWGARTTLGADAMASEWKYVPIRRLALMIEESLFRGTKWVVFEPNDEPLWAKIRQNVGAFMMTLFRQGAFQGGTPDKAFYVKCDGETTTAADRNLGIVNIEVGFAPLKPAEFVVLKIQQIPDLT